MPRFTLLILAILLFWQPLAAQDNPMLMQKLDSLQYTAEMPEGILQTKSLALVSVPPKSTNPYVRGNWKKVAEEAQPGFRKAGVDVSSYYYIEDVFSGPETVAAFLSDFKKREFENVVFLILDKGTYRVVLTKLSDEQSLVKAGQQAWQTSNSDLSVALDNLYKAAANSSQERENLLVLEVPEFGTMANPIKGRRGEYYDLNFSSEKLAVPMFADTAKLNQVMADYPYKYGFVATGLDEKKIRSEGYQYMLYFVHTTGKSVKEMLEYPVTETETAYVSEVVKDGQPRVTSYSINTPVYKFYIKHIYSGNVFLGKKWDAAATWEKALENYIDNLRTELVHD